MNSPRIALGIGLLVGLALGWFFRSQLELARKPARQARVKRSVLAILKAAKDE